MRRLVEQLSRGIHNPIVAQNASAFTGLPFAQAMVEEPISAQLAVTVLLHLVAQVTPRLIREPCTDNIHDIGGEEGLLLSRTNGTALAWLLTLVGCHQDFEK